jgi:uncharacterized protein YciI
MSEHETHCFLYQFDPVRPEMVTDRGTWTADDERIGEAHFNYLKKAAEDGIVILAGRSLDGVGPAIVILEAASEQEALRFMENDPFVAGGLMRARLHPFRPSLVRKH